MSKSIEIKGPHNFEKENLMTQKDRKGIYDKMFCTECGIKGKRRGFTHVEVDGRYSQDKIENCIGQITPPEIIRITDIIHALGNQFSNLTPGSIHKTVDPPEGYTHDRKGVWVMGVGEPVKVLNEEFEAEEQS